MKTSATGLSIYGIVVLLGSLTALAEDCLEDQPAFYTPSAISAQAAGDRTLTLVSGVLAGQSVSSSQPAITVNPGASIQGSIVVSAYNAMSPTAIAPLCATPTWGVPSTSYWGIDPWIGTGTTTHTVNVNLTAPSSVGTYYIVVAFAGTYNYEQIMSGTHPAYTADWVNGNKVAILPANNFETGIVQHWISFNWYVPGTGMTPGDLALTAVRVVVTSTGGGGGGGGEGDGCTASNHASYWALIVPVALAGIALLRRRNPLRYPI